jgi:7,8-dihydropterin-6-yl-methyl-4-(beta-D-ribofuranosyl)aminobenzene 5'-phosphate synthase
MRITVLAGNSVCKSTSMNLKAETGLSLFIEFDERKILFDTSQSDIFIKNARQMGIDLSQVDYLIISNVHFNSGGGLKHFQKINKKAKVFLHINAAKKYYTRIFGLIPYRRGPDQKAIAKNSRIYFIKEDTQVDDNFILLEGFTDTIPQPESNKWLSVKTENPFRADKFNHELAMLLVENDEIVLFSGCSHSGIVNIIEEVKLYSKTMKIKATFGDPVFYSGHCTGEPNFRFINSCMCRKIQTINTGEVIEI